MPGVFVGNGSVAAEDLLEDALKPKEGVCYSSVLEVPLFFVLLTTVTHVGTWGQIYPIAEMQSVSQQMPLREMQLVCHLNRPIRVQP